MAKMTKLQRSNNAHLRLNRKYHSRDNTAKNRAFGNYHAYCVDEQRKLGRVLTKVERKKLFADSCRLDGYKPSK